MQIRRPSIYFTMGGGWWPLDRTRVLKALGLVIDLVSQMEMSSLLALNVDERAICDFLVGLPVQRHPDRKVARLIASNDLDATHGLAPGPLSNGLQALFSESPIAQSDCLAFRHPAWPGRQRTARGVVSRILAFSLVFVLYDCGQAGFRYIGRKLAHGLFLRSANAIGMLK